MEPKTSRRNLTRAERRRQAVELRIEGHTFEVIGRIMGINRSNAYRLVKSELDQINKETRESAEGLRALEAMRLDSLHRAMWDKAIDGNFQAVDRVLKIMSRRAKLLGLDKPAQERVVAAIKPDDGILDDEMSEKLMEIIASAEFQRLNNTIN